MSRNSLAGVRPSYGRSRDRGHSAFPAEIETKGEGWTCTLPDPKPQIPAASAAAGNAEAADGGCPNPKPITSLTENRHGRSAS